MMVYEEYVICMVFGQHVAKNVMCILMLRYACLKSEG